MICDRAPEARFFSQRVWGREANSTVCCSEVDFEKLKCLEFICQEYHFAPSIKGTEWDWYFLMVGEIIFWCYWKFSGYVFGDAFSGDKKGNLPQSFSIFFIFPKAASRKCCVFVWNVCHENIDLNKNEKLQEIIYAIVDSYLLQILVVLILPHGRMAFINIE